MVVTQTQFVARRIVLTASARSSLSFLAQSGGSDSLVDVFISPIALLKAHFAWPICAKSPLSHRKG